MYINVPGIFTAISENVGLLQFSVNITENSVNLRILTIP